jgi:hypothetical protein
VGRLCCFLLGLEASHCRRTAAKASRLSLCSSNISRHKVLGSKRDIISLRCFRIISSILAEVASLCSSKKKITSSPPWPHPKTKIKKKIYEPLLRNQMMNARRAARKTDVTTMKTTTIAI